jgi:hypothetical protein
VAAQLEAPSYSGRVYQRNRHEGTVSYNMQLTCCRTSPVFLPRLPPLSSSRRASAGSGIASGVVATVFHNVVVLYFAAVHHVLPGALMWGQLRKF